MWKLWFICTLISLLICLCSSVAIVAAAQGSRTRHSKWLTLSGKPPLVIARGGFSGVFPDSSSYAYQLAVETGLPNLHLWCDVQLTKDGHGVCLPDVRLENASDIDSVYSDRRSTYSVDGVPLQGWFSMDFTLNDLRPVNLKQRIYTRAPNFDGTPMEILTPNDVISLAKPQGLWLSVPHDAFFSQHNLSMRSYIVSVSKRMVVNYISSPEVGFLRSITSRFRTSPTKLIFQFLGPDDIEPTTNQTYSFLIKNFKLIKEFATGILVPKNYIYPVDNSLYLQNYSSLVLDAHKAGLGVFASNFMNDAPLPYDYSYDPVSEYLSFVDNGRFSVDGVLSDFPITPSAAIDCFSHMGKNKTVQAELLIISSEGASGDYPGCTDKAYAKAVSDGVDILDCPVQMTNDGVPFCLGSINLRDKTNAAESNFSNMATTNSDLNITDGIFTYNLSWSQIQMLKPAISNPFSKFRLYRNPRARYDGKLMQLSDFLEFSENESSVSGVLISIENAAYLAEKQGLDVTRAVLDALAKAGYNNQTAKKVMIKSSDSAVLSKFKYSGKYELVYLVDEDVRDILNSTILEIKRIANSVVISKKSVFPSDHLFLTGETTIVPKLQAFKLPVYVQYFRNEFVSQPWDFFSDPYVEINTHVFYMGINGVITDYPGTASKFRRNRCLGYESPPPYMSPVQPGGLIPIMATTFLPPAQPPNPILTANDVVEPPLPPVVQRPPTVGNLSGSVAPGPVRPPNGQPTIIRSSKLGVFLAVLVSILWLSG
ncbi:Glycerophosphodiester phosphodiesterase GDPDL3 [Striga hermonthica]|uniref:glycerophosphodiester phosphodiesterase n=1 Tax=Striga hermonthica TaxID=68872 RepID=A0A9N7R707_STRHE|nr:Glycerophosphodiester phosphodiesterase GDPDL3 [Striga hermonthica]